MSPISFGTQYIYFYTCPQGGSDDDGRSNDFMGVKLVLLMFLMEMTFIGGKGREGFAPYGTMTFMGVRVVLFLVFYGAAKIVLIVFYESKRTGSFLRLKEQ